MTRGRVKRERERERKGEVKIPQRRRKQLRRSRPCKSMLSESLPGSIVLQFLFGVFPPRRERRTRELKSAPHCAAFLASSRLPAAASPPAPAPRSRERAVVELAAGAVLARARPLEERAPRLPGPHGQPRLAAQADGKGAGVVEATELPVPAVAGLGEEVAGRGPRALGDRRDDGVGRGRERGLRERSGGVGAVACCRRRRDAQI